MSIPIEAMGSAARASGIPNRAEFDAHLQAQRALTQKNTAGKPGAANPQTVALKNGGGGQPLQMPLSTQRPLQDPVPSQPADQPSEQRKKDIDGWVDHKSDASGGFLGFGETSAAEHVHDALTGKSDLGTLTPAEQRYLVDRALARWERNGWGPGPDAHDLADRVKGDPALRQIVGESFAARSAHLMEQPRGNGSGKDPHTQAEAYAYMTLDLMGDDKAGLAQTLGGLSPDDGVRFAQSLAEGGGNSFLPMQADQKILAALNSAPPSQTTSAMVQTIYSQMKPGDIMHMPELRHEMAVAIAREWYPDKPGERDAAAGRLERLMDGHEGQMLLFGGTLERNVAALAAVRSDPSITAETLKGYSGDVATHPAVAKAMAEGMVLPGTENRDAEVSRLTGILQTKQGQELLFGSPTSGDGVPLQARSMARQILLSDRTITADTLRNPPDPTVHNGSSPWIDRDNPWHNPAIVEAMARANATPFTSDAPTILTGQNVENLVGTAMGARVKLPDGVTEQQAWADAQAGTFSFYAAGPDNGMVAPVASKIREIGGDNPQVTALPITYSSPETGPVRLTLFRVHTAQGDKFVDNKGAVYNSFDHWRTANQLPAGLMFYPEGGHIATNPDGTLKLASAYTPKTPDTAGEKVVDVLDKAALVGGIVAGGALIIGTGGTAGLVFAAIGAGAGTWGAIREGSQLYERSQLGLSINPVTDGEARTLWLGLAANATGVGAFASEAALIRFVQAESAIARPAALAVGTARVSATVTNAAAFTNAGVDLIGNWESMTPDQRAMAVLQMGFWGVTTGVGARQARSFGELINPAAAARTVMDTYQPAVLRDSQLEGNRVEIRFDPATGAPVVYAGDRASAGDIQLHVNAVRAMARDQGLTGLIQQLVGEPKPGTLGYSLKYENIKLGQKLESLRIELGKPNLTAQQRTQIEGDIATIEAYQGQLAETAGRIAANPAEANIAAPSDGQVRADEIQQGLGDALEPGYYWRSRGPDTLPEIVRTEATQNRPKLALVESETHPGQYEIKEVSSDVVEPDYVKTPDKEKSVGLRSSLASIGGQEGQDLATQFDAAIAERNKLVTDRNNVLDGRKPEKLTGDDKAQYDALNQKVVEQSQIIGELGAYGFVKTQYPGAELVYGGPGAKSRPGDFDLVFRLNQPDGSVTFIVVEAKGGSSPLGTRQVGTTIETQGTRKYFEAIAENMTGMTGDENAGARRTGAELLAALDGTTVDGKPAGVIYITTRSGVDGTGANVNMKQFDIGQ